MTSDLAINTNSYKQTKTNGAKNLISAEILLNIIEKAFEDSEVILVTEPIHSASFKIFLYQCILRLVIDTKFIWLWYIKLDIKVVRFIR